MASEWITGRAFIPKEGATYEVNFGKIQYKGQLEEVSVRILTKSMMPKDWIDLDTDEPLDPELANYVVWAYRPL